MEGQEHFPGYAAVAEVAGGTGAEFDDVLGFGEVHFEEAANAGGQGEQVEGGLGGFRGVAQGDLGAGGVGGVDGGLVFGQDAGFGEEIDVGREVGGGGGFVAVEGGEGLDDLGAAAMAVQVAEAADVHEEVEAESGAGLEGA